MGKRYGIIPALDCDTLEEARDLVARLGHHPMVRGFKIGFSLGLSYGLPQVVEALRPLTEQALIYDHQKAGTDIPATGALFARTLSRAGIDAAILFPQAGPRTQRAWIQALQDAGVQAICGGAMTHPAYLASEGGYLCDDSVISMYKVSREAGVAAYVLPLTRPDLARSIAMEAGIGPDCTVMSPGFGAQGGDPAAFDFLARHDLIVGRSLMHAADPEAYLNTIQAQLEGP
jgi:orotidine-5'-phosphate decarboxylase